MSQSSVAQYVEQDRMRSIALAAARRDALCRQMQAAPGQTDRGPKTLQAFVDAHWQFQFTTCGAVECVCCAWVNVCGILGVARFPRASDALVHGAYGAGMRSKTPSQNTWRREVLESHLGLPCGPTSSRKNVHTLGHHHQLGVPTAASGRRRSLAVVSTWDDFFWPKPPFAGSTQLSNFLPHDSRSTSKTRFKRPSPISHMSPTKTMRHLLGKVQSIRDPGM